VVPKSSYIVGSFLLSILGLGSAVYQSRSRATKASIAEDNFVVDKGKALKSNHSKRTGRAAIYNNMKRVKIIT